MILWRVHARQFPVPVGFQGITRHNPTVATQSMKSSFLTSNQATLASVPLIQYARRALSSGRFTLAATLLALLLLFTLMSASLPTRAADKHGQGRNLKESLTGNWMVTVTRVNPPPSLAPNFLTLVTYFEDGNLLHESNSADFNGAGRGKWERTGHREFSLSFTFFRFDSERTYLGIRRVTSTITLSPDGNEYQADSVGQDYDPSGNPQKTLLATGVGRRL